MIVLDGSALFAILLGEPKGRACADAIEEADTLLLSAASLTELFVVAACKDMLADMQSFVQKLDPEIEVLTAERARAAADAYTRWGKGFHEAKLNFGDCFAYALAKEHVSPLLFVGNDFAKTDVTPALC